jgi:predicted amidohydrolase YtcJ
MAHHSTFATRSASTSDLRQKPRMAADLVLTNGKIWTENAVAPEVEALAIRSNRVIAAGSSSEMEALADHETKVVDLDGKRAVPGFNDAHLHLYMGGASLAGVQLRTAKSAAEFRERVAAFARSQPKGEWILGGNWNQGAWIPAGAPHHKLIDDVTPDNPVFVISADGHMMLANALAMKLAGVNGSTADIPGGLIVRDQDRTPTGVFKDAATALIRRVVPVPTQKQIKAAILAAQQHALEHGVTSVQDMGVIGALGPDTMKEVIRAYQELGRSGELQIRVSAHLPLPEYRRFADAGIAAGFGNEYLRVGGVKSFSDGSLGSKTAWFFDPYNDAPETNGIPSDELSDAEGMYRNLVEADRAGLQIAVHAIGDRANRTVLDFFEKLEQQNGRRERRLRIEHAQHLCPSDIPRFAQLNVIASMQPYHSIDDGCWADGRIGAERAKTTYACGSLLRANAVLAFGSDWFVAPIDPLQGIYAAVTRRTLDGKRPEGWVPEQKISVEEAVHAYTVGSAYASMEEGMKGSLEPGKLADIAVLSDDIFSIEPAAIRETKVDMTIFDGRVIYKRSGI